MPNDYFQFKQFRIHQDQCAQKVCTDSCIFGAWVNVQQSQRILDVGTGTGLLALMAAQRSSAVIDAVELVPEAAKQARENVLGSKWHDRIAIHTCSIQDYVPEADVHYDHIISNPPFYNGSTLSGSYHKQLASHDISLTTQTLLLIAETLLQAEGLCSIIIPSESIERLQSEAKEVGLYPSKVLSIWDRDSAPANRDCITFSRRLSSVIEESLCIRTKEGEYTSEFVNLLGDYYLYL